MTQRDDFIATLHVIAASAAPIDRQMKAVRQVFTRAISDGRRSRDQLRVWLAKLEIELTMQSLQHRAGRFSRLRDYARELAANWLRENPER